MFDDEAIAEPQDAVRTFRSLRVVRDHDDGGA
jgi:hypothetical protein